MAKPGEIFYIDARGVKAKGVVTETGFILMKGSEIRPKIASYLNKTRVDLRHQCESDGTIVDWKMTRDMEFNSPSTAAYFLFGANASGPQTWKDENGMTMLEHDKLASGVFKEATDREDLGFLKTVEGNEGSKCHYPTRLDTYGCGCGHDCNYCYAKDMILRLSGEWDPLKPKIADVWRIENRIKRGELKAGDIVRLGGLTDCFQPAEIKYRATLETIKILNKYNIGYLIVTKSHFVANDEYIEVMRKDLAHIQITTTTFDADLCAQYEKASPPQKRVEAIEKLQALGFDVFLRLSPYIDGWVDFDKLNAVKCDKILVEFLRVNTTILRRFDIPADDYTISEAGYLHLPLAKKLEILSKITGFKEVSVCDDCTESYEYFRDHFNPNPDDCCNLRLK
jgi:DNA repair photolyase